MEMVNLPLGTKRTDLGTFRGFEQQLFPALGVRNLRLFTGVEEDLLESVVAGQARPERIRRQRARQQGVDRMPATMSVSNTGTCLIIEGLE